MKPSDLRKAQERLLRAIDDHHALVYRVAYRVLGSREDAEDITQEVYLACIERPEMLRSVRNLRSYLVRAALNRARSLIRRRKSGQKSEEAWAMEYARRRREEGLSAKETGVQEAIAALPEELRMPLVLYYEEGLKHREIAAVLGCPRGTVTDRLATGRARLRERLAQAGVVLPGKELERLLRGRHAPEIPLSPTLARRIRDGVERKVAALPAAPAAASATLFSSAGVAIALGLGLSFAGGFALIAGAGRLDEGSRAAYGEERLQGDSRGLAARDSAMAALRWRRGLLRGERNHAVAELSPEEGADSEDAGTEGSVVPARGFFGRVEDESGDPLEGVTVRYVGPHGTVRAETKSREDGSYMLEVPIEEPPVAPTMYLRADIDHGLTEEYYVSYVHNLEAHRGGVLTADEVTLTDVRERTNYWGFSNGEQGDHGYGYALEDLRDPQALGDVLVASGSGDGTLEAFADGFIAAAGKVDALSEEQPTREVDLVLYPASDVRGRVVDSTGEGVPSAHVRVVGWLSEEDIPSAVLEVDTGPDGSFRFSSLPEGAYLVQAVAPGHVTLETVVRTGAPARLDLRPAARLEVRAEDESGEVRGIRVRLLDRGRLASERSADDDSPPTFEKVPAGEYILQIFRPDAELPSSEETLVLEGNEDLELTVSLPLPCTVTGQILDPSGAAPVGEVRFHPLDTTWLRGDGCVSDHPEPGKAYSVSGLAPGRYLVTVTEREGQGLPLLHREVFVRPGERVARRDLVLDLARGSLELSFPAAPKAPDSDFVYGSPVSHAIRVYREDTGEPVLSVGLGPGSHTLALPGGLYTVEVERAGCEPWRTASLWVPPLGTRRVDVTLLPKTDPLPAPAGSGQVSLRHACRLGSVLELLGEELSGNVAWSRAVERDGILENAWLEGFRGPVSELVERIERIGPTPLLVRGAGQGLFIDSPR